MIEECEQMLARDDDGKCSAEVTGMVNGAGGLVTVLSPPRRHDLTQKKDYSQDRCPGAVSSDRQVTWDTSRMAPLNQGGIGFSGSHCGACSSGAHESATQEMRVHEIPSDAVAAVKEHTEQKVICFGGGPLGCQGIVPLQKNLLGGDYG